MEAPGTQRAYTLRLRASSPLDRAALWATHNAINQGARVFGDWLLTLRGGLDHRLAGPTDSSTGGGGDEEGAATERRNRRILLALSWLSVEDEAGAPRGEVRVARGNEPEADRIRKVLTAFQEILRGRGVSDTEIGAVSASPPEQPGTWIADCGASLSAAIRQDAVWVNRSKRFDEVAAGEGSSLTRDVAWDLLEPLLGDPDVYLGGIVTGTGDASPDGERGESKAKDLVKKAGQWLCDRFGTGKGADFADMAKRYDAIADWAGAATADAPGHETLGSLAASLGRRPGSRDLPDVLGLVSGPGHKSKTRNMLKAIAGKSGVSQEDLRSLEKQARDDATKCRRNVGKKGARPWANQVLRDVEDACGFTYIQKRGGRKANGGARHVQFAVMLDHAARRVSAAHTWIKRAEGQRQDLARDAERLRAVPSAARAWLDAYCRERSSTSGSVGEYRIRRRAIAGWKEVLSRWSRSTCMLPADRMAAAREVQRDPDPELEKFGDIQLFEALAADDARCVWQVNGSATPEPLQAYVAATDALARQRRFKVPTYRHPDPLLHPVFGDFGKSRWKIRFAVHEAAQGTRRRRNQGPQEADWLGDRHGVRLGLWDGTRLRDVNFRWSSKRMVRDLALAAANGGGSDPAVSRADRLGRAAAGLDAAASARVRGLLELRDWNGRLQAPRLELDAIARRVRKFGWDSRARAMRDRIGWLLSFSARLTCAGPFIDYAREHGIEPIKGQYHPNADLNKDREGNARLILSRLPDLRVLSVDLGHRFAAACAVWQAISTETLVRETEGSNVLLGGRGAGDMYLHVVRPASNGRTRTAIYRRIGSDQVMDRRTTRVEAHPAPWARLDRQFLIKLQGEERPARAASPAEMAAVADYEHSLGRVRGPFDPLPRDVDKLMSEAVRTARLALRAHGDAARIAYAFRPDARHLLPGGGSRPHTPETRNAATLDALLRWHGMKTEGNGWHDPWAADQWNRLISPKLARLDGAATPPAAGADREERKRHRTELEELLGPVAIALDGGEAARFHDLWAAHWSANDALWRPRLRWLRRWLLPRGLGRKSGEAREEAAARRVRLHEAWHVGGLSLGRIATLRELYQVQKAYAMRPEPTDPRKNVPAPGDTGLDRFGRRTLLAMERLREQRVKQLASRIVEAALGVGRVRSPRRSKDPKRPRARVDEPCHAVVIESLRNYRPDELRTRRENRALMNWSAGKVRKYLEESCQLHGLHLREISPNYTSRQDSRTGLPGVRCDDVPVQDFLTHPRWRKAVNRAREKVSAGGSDPLDRYLLDLDGHAGATCRQQGWTTLRIPTKGGNLFVAAPPHGKYEGKPRVLQADLNAAANIGLRALLDPDFPGRWWYVPCVEDMKAGTAIPRADRVKGSACFGKNPCSFGSLAAKSAAGTVARAEGRRGRGRRGSSEGEAEITNYWADPGAVDLKPASEGGRWLATPAYWNLVRRRVVAALRAQAGLGDASPAASEPRTG